MHHDAAGAQVWSIPELSRVGQLVNPNATAARLNIELTREAAAGVQAVTVNREGVAFQAREFIAKLALLRRLAFCAYSRETFEPGAFMSYGKPTT